MTDESFRRRTYRGRLAPSPTGFLHLGHARTFWIAHQRALDCGGTLVLRVEDLDRARCKTEFTRALFEDLRWFGIHWQEGPDCGGAFGPYVQSERLELYRAAFEKLQNLGAVYPCTCSRKDIQQALQAPHAEDDEPIYPGTCRERYVSRFTDYALADVSIANRQSPIGSPQSPIANRPSPTAERKMNWRFRVPDGEVVSFVDGGFGPQRFTAGKDLGDFVVWRQDGFPSYQLAVVVDDAAMQITEVVRGADLLRSTARQLLLYRALGWPAPALYHCPLMTDEAGQRLAKRHDALSLQALRGQGLTPESLRKEWN